AISRRVTRRRRGLPRDRLGPTREDPVRTREVAGVPVRIPLEVVLMLRLCLPERACRCHLGHDRSWPKTRRLDIGDGVLGDPALLLVRVEDRRAIARPDVVSLAVQRRRVVDLEEELEQLPVGDPLRVEDDLDRFGVRPVIAVGRVRNIAAAVANASGKNPGPLPEKILHPPEASTGENRRLSCLAHFAPPPSPLYR